MSKAKHHPDRCTKRGCKSCLYRKDIKCFVCRKTKTFFRQGLYCSEKCKNKIKYKRRKAARRAGDRAALVTHQPVTRAEGSGS